MKKSLLIMGAYVKSYEGEDILHEAVKRLCPYFDIALVTHTPVGKHVQNNIKYFIYDHRNELMYNKIATIFWGKTDKYYYEMHPDNSRGYHYFAVYRSMMNAVKLLCDDYDSFVYVEGDCHYAPKDAIKLQELITDTKESGKQAFFISYGDFLNTNMFYCDMEFFKNVFGFYKNSDDYMARCDQIGSHGLLENFLYMSAKHGGVIDNMHIIDGYTSEPLFSKESKFDMNRNTGKEITEKTSYTFEVLRIKNTNDIAVLYMASEGRDGTLPIYLDDHYIMDLPSTNHNAAFKITPENDRFVIKIGANEFSFDKNKILNNNNKSFIELT